MPPGYESPQPREPADFPSKPTPASAPPVGPSLLQSKTSHSHLLHASCTVSLFLLSSLWLSLRRCGRGAGYFLLLCIFLLNRESFHFLPKLSVLLFTACPGLETTLPIPPEHQENGELTATDRPRSTLQPLRSKGNSSYNSNPPGAGALGCGVSSNRGRQGSLAPFRPAQASNLPCIPLTAQWANPGLPFTWPLLHSAQQTRGDSQLAPEHPQLCLPGQFYIWES